MVHQLLTDEAQLEIGTQFASLQHALMQKMFRDIARMVANQENIMDHPLILGLSPHVREMVAKIDRINLLLFMSRLKECHFNIKYTSTVSLLPVVTHMSEVEKIFANVVMVDGQKTLFPPSLFEPSIHERNDCDDKGLKNDIDFECSGTISY